VSPTVDYAPLGQLRGRRRVAFIPLAEVLARLDKLFEEPLDRAASLPGYAEYEAALTELDGWPATAEPLVMLRVAKGEPRPVISGLHVLAAAKKVGKATVPCIFIHKDDVAAWSSANAEGGLKPPRASDLDEDDETAFYRAYWLD
jgi:hypothetical protein